jgi:hypothetical protein
MKSLNQGRGFPVLQDGPVSTVSPSSKGGASATSGKRNKKAKVSDPIPPALDTRTDDTHGELHPGVSKAKSVKSASAAPNRDATGAQPLGSPEATGGSGKKRKAGDDVAQHSQGGYRGVGNETELLVEGGEVATDAAVSAGPPAKVCTLNECRRRRPGKLGC